MAILPRSRPIPARPARRVPVACSPFHWVPQTSACSPTGTATHVADSVLDEGTIRALAEAVTGLAAD
jgi:hypothetical protein